MGFRRLVHRLLFRPDVVEGIEWELAHHLEERVDELKATGLGEEEARRAAERSLGDGRRLRAQLQRIDRDHRRRERMREFLGTVWQDVRYGARGLAHNAGFAGAVVLTLALGIGANGALFSVADALLLRPLPYAAPGELVKVVQATPEMQRGMPYLSPSLARDWLSRQGAVEAAFVYSRPTLTYTGGAEPVALPGLLVSEGFEETLGVQPALGRGIVAADTEVGAQPVVVVSHDFWVRALGGTPDVLGREIELGAHRHVVVGVMPRGFKYPMYATTDFWLPLYPDDQHFTGRVRFVEMVARVRGGGIEAAEAEVAALAGALIREQRPESEASWRLEPLAEGRASSAELRQAMQLLGGAVALILLIAGVNMVNLLLLRSAARTREIAVRLALGASRWRLVRQLGTEAMLLALLSGLVAAALAFGALRMLQHIMPSSITFWAPHAIAIEERTLLFTFCLAVGSGFVFGLLPALRATRLATADVGGGALTAHTTHQPAGSASLRRVLVTAEVALSVTLLVGAGLLMGSFVRLARVDPGLELERLAVLDVSVSTADYPSPEQRGAYLRLLQERVGSVPGVHSTTVTTGLPPRGAGIRFGIAFETEDDEPRPYHQPLPFTSIDHDFFAVTGARLVSGRPFHRGEDEESGAVIIDEDLARHLWPGRNAVGRRFRNDPQSPWLTVVGVIADLKLGGPDDRERDFEVFHPLGRYEALERAVIAIRTEGDPRAVLQPVRAAVHGVNPRQVIGTLDTAGAQYATATDMQRFLFMVITALALLALTLAAVGLYGLLSYGVARRRREIGVRMALGATTAHVHRLVLGEALAMTAAGAAIGIVGALAMSRFIEATLYGVEPTDAATYGAVAAVIFGVALLASLSPAQRAAGVEPAAVIRAD